MGRSVDGLCVSSAPRSDNAQVSCQHSRHSFRKHFKNFEIYCNERFIRNVTIGSYDSQQKHNCNADHWTEKLFELLNFTNSLKEFFPVGLFFSTRLEFLQEKWVAIVKDQYRCDVLKLTVTPTLSNRLISMSSFEIPFIFHFIMVSIKKRRQNNHSQLWSIVLHEIFLVIETTKQNHTNRDWQQMLDQR